MIIIHLCKIYGWWCTKSTIFTFFNTRSFTIFLGKSY